VNFEKKNYSGILSLIKRRVRHNGACFQPLGHKN